MVAGKEQEHKRSRSRRPLTSGVSCSILPSTLGSSLQAASSSCSTLATPDTRPRPGLRACEQSQQFYNCVSSRGKSSFLSKFWLTQDILLLRLYIILKIISYILHHQNKSDNCWLYFYIFLLFFCLYNPAPGQKKLHKIWIPQVLQGLVLPSGLDAVCWLGKHPATQSLHCWSQTQLSERNRNVPI